MGFLKKYFYHHQSLWLILGFGLACRFLVMGLTPFKVDMDAWVAWAYRLAEFGPWQFYSPTIWTNYTPGFLYPLWFIGSVNQIFDLPIIWLSQIIKIPAIFSDLLLASFIYFLTFKNQPKISLILAGLIALNPFVIFNSTIWGQIDSFLTLAMFISIYYLNKQNYLYSSIAYAIALLIKPQAIAIAPIYLLFIAQHLITRKQIQLNNIAKLFFPGFLTLLLLSWPFFITNPFLGLISLIKTMSEDYSYNSLFAYNFWGIFGFWKSDAQLWGPLSWHHWSILMFAGFWIAISYFYFRHKLKLFTVATLACLAFYFLPTRVHDRYLFPALIFLVFAIAETKSYRLIWLFIPLSLFHTLNLYQVYVYYNEFYYSLPRQLYLPFIFDTLQQSAHLISLASTVIFIAVSILLFKAKNESQKFTKKS